MNYSADKNTLQMSLQEEIFQNIDDGNYQTAAHLAQKLGNSSSLTDLDYLAIGVAFGKLSEQYSEDDRRMLEICKSWVEWIPLTVTGKYEFFRATTLRSIDAKLQKRGPQLSDKKKLKSQIKVLKDQGNLKEALMLAYQLEDNDNLDFWDYIQIGWLYVKAIYEAQQNSSDSKEVLNLVQRLTAIPTLDDQKFEAARELAIINTYVKLIKDQLGKDPLSVRVIDSYLVASRQWIHCSEGERLLFQAKQYVKKLYDDTCKKSGQSTFDFADFALEFGLDRLSCDAWQRQKKEILDQGSAVQNGTNFWPALAEDVIRLAAKDAIKRDSKSNVRNLLPYIKKAEDRFNDNAWLTIIYVKSLRFLGELDEAIKHCLPLVRKKSTEFWLWDLLSSLYADKDDKNLSLSCIARALLCHQSDDFKGKLHLKFAQALVERNQFKEAMSEYQTVIRTYEEHGWNTPKEISIAMSAEWWDENCSLPEGNKSLYKTLSEGADELLFSHIPWSDAVLGEERKVEKEAKARFKRVVYIDTNDEIPFSCQADASIVQWKGAEIGAPICVQYERQDNGTLKILRMKPRSSGKFNDVFIPKLGVISHVDPQKNIAYLSMENKSSLSINLNGISSYKVGQILKCYPYSSRKRNAQGQSVSKIYCYKVETTNEASDQLVRSFNEQYIDVKEEGYGFVNEMYVDKALVQKCELEDSDTVSGKALLTFNAKRKEWGWKVFEIERNESEELD